MIDNQITLLLFSFKGQLTMTSLPVGFKSIRKLKFYLTPNIFEFLNPIFRSIEKCDFTGFPMFKEDGPEFGIKEGM